MNDSVFITDLGDAAMQNHYHLQQSRGHSYRMSPRSRYVYVLGLVSSSHHHNSHMHSEQNQTQKQQPVLVIQFYWAF